MESTKRCPYRAEDIRAEAIKCKHCGSALNSPPSAPSARSTISPTRQRVGTGCGLLLGLFMLAAVAHWLFGGSSNTGVSTQEPPVLADSPRVAPGSSVSAESSAKSPSTHVPASGGPSFNCAKASSGTEKLICGNPELSDLDASYARLYKRAKALAPDQAVYVEEGKEALRHRNQDCSDEACLFDWYKQRGNQLAHLVLQQTDEPGKDNCVPLYDETQDESDRRYHLIASSYAQRHGETEDDYYQRAGTTARDAEAFALAAESCGSSIDDALESLESTHGALTH